MRSYWWVSLTAVLASVSSCIDTKRSFDDFNDRFEAKRERDRIRMLEAGVGPEDGAVCVPITAEALSGRYYFALLSPVAPTTPILAILDVAAKGSGAKLEAELVLDPVEVKDKRTPVGQKNESTMTVEDDAFTTPVFEVIVPGNADPVLEGTAIKATLKLSGSTCWSGEGPLDLLCGAAAGDITEPLPAALGEATFGAMRIVEGEEFPPIVRSCADRTTAP